MKALFSLIAILATVFPLSSQHQQWEAGLTFETYNSISCMGNDAYGNVYVGGHYTDSYRWEESAGFFIAKFDSNGALVWSDTTDALVLLEAMYTDDKGNSTLLINMAGSMILGQSVIKPDSWVAMLVRYDASGNVIWHKQFRDVTAAGMKADGAGSFYVSGRFGYDPHDSTFFGNNLLVGYGYFLAKFDNNGTCAWAKQVGGQDAVNQNFTFKGPRMVSGAAASIVMAMPGNAGGWLVNRYDGNGDPTDSLSVWLSFYSMDRTGNLYQMNTSLYKTDFSGDTLWTFAPKPNGSVFASTDYNNAVFSSEVESDGQGTIYGTRIRQHDTATGSMSWEYFAAQRILQTYSDSKGNVYGYGLDGSVYGGPGFPGPAILVKLNDNAVEIAENFVSGAAGIFPNPCSGMLNVSYPGITSIDVEDIHARSINCHIETGTSGATVDVSNLLPGIYALKLSTGTAQTCRRFVVDR